MSNITMPEMIAKGVNLAAHTTIRVGGDAEYFAVAETMDELLLLTEWAREAGEGVFILGNGSNVIISDEGVPGLTIVLGRGFRMIEGDGNGVIVGGAVMMPLVGRRGMAEGWGEFLFMAQIPGSVAAGALMNAGADGGEFSKIVNWVEILTPAGEVKRLTRAELSFGYRTSSLKEAKGTIITRVSLVNREKNIPLALAGELVRERRFARLDRQPSDGRNFGSTFKNPPGKSPAGKLIEEAGLKGARVGDAVVSEKHANWIINERGATAVDIRALILKIKEEVYNRFGIALNREVLYIPEDIR